MRRMLSILGSAIFLVIAPGIVAGYVPWRICRWQIGAPLLGTPWSRLPGVLLIAAGLPVLLDSFARFAIQGLGTPAPVMPTRHLVVTGLYRYVRNPMYVGFISGWVGLWVVFGRASLTALEVAVAAILAVELFVRLYEEPHLRGKFGADYEEYCRNVPRWIPRLRPWTN